MTQHPGRTRVLIADDCEPVLREIEVLLAPEFDVVGKVQRGDLLISATAEAEPDVVVTDIAMPGVDGITASRAILECHPDLPIVLLTVCTDAEVAVAALRFGIRGYVHKLHAGEELIPALQAALAGQVFVSPSCSRAHAGSARG